MDSADPPMRLRGQESIQEDALMSRINGDKARNDRQRKHREKLRVKTRELREHLAASGKTSAAPSAPAAKTSK